MNTRLAATPKANPEMVESQTPPRPMTCHDVLPAMPAGRVCLARTFDHGLLGLPEVANPPHLAARGGCWSSLSAAHR